MLAQPAAAPEDWTGSVDINSEDFPGSTPQLFRDWQNELERIEEPEINIDQN
jgi:hypothetical protein